MKCLKVDYKWLRLILEGKKTWEIRRTNTNYRGRIALGNTKTKNYERYAILIDCKEYTTKTFAWVLSDVMVESNPKPYSYTTGSWCMTETLNGMVEQS
jgi:hypothetical protein